jgi:hypothetical protein
MPKDIWKEVFKAGLHTDAGGNEKDWTIEDLDTIAAKYNNQLPDEKHEAPVVIGHPVNNSPAYAWVDELKRDGERLLAKFNQLDPEFEQLIRDGKYKKVSIALYPDMMLRHVGYLGAVPPAVKGLKDTNFNSDEAFVELMFEENSTNARTESNTCSTDDEQKGNKNEQKKRKEKKRNIYFSPSKSEDYEEHYPENNRTPINFQGGSMPETLMPENYAKLFEDLLTWLGQTFNEEIANQTAEELEKIKDRHIRKDENPPKPVEANDGKDKIDLTQSKEYQEMQRKLESLENDNREMKFNEYFNSQTGRLVPAQKNLVRLAFETARGNDKGFEFSENGVTKTLRGEDVIKKLIESFPTQVEFSEIANKALAGNDNSFEEQNKFIDEYYKNEGDR